MVNIAWNPHSVVYCFDQLLTSTRPLIVETRSGRSLLKYLGNPKGPTALAMEWIGLHAARGMGIPIPDFSVIQIESHQAEMANGMRPGPALAIRWESITAWNHDPLSINNIVRDDFFASLCVVDTWLLNRDRYGDPRDGDEHAHSNYHNVQVRSAGDQASQPLAIDFTEAFHGGTALGSVPLSAVVGWDHIYGCFPEIRKSVPHQSIVAAAQRLGSGAWQEAHKAVESCPREWWTVPLPDRGTVANLIRDRALTVASSMPLLISGYISPTHPTIFDA